MALTLFFASADQTRPDARLHDGVWGDGWADSPFDGFGGPGPVEDDELVFAWPRVTRFDALRAAARSCAEETRAPWLDAMRREAAQLLRACDASALPRPAQAARLSLATRINAGRLWSALEPMHESLSAAAWLGWLASGRAALLPPSLAAAVADALADDALGESVAAVGGARRLARIARAVRSDGRARIVRPARRPIFWNRLALQRLRVGFPGEQAGERRSWCGIGD